MLEVMSEAAKKALEYGLSFALLLGATFYLNNELTQQKKEFTASIEAVSKRLESCELDKLDLSGRVSSLQATLDIITSGSEPRKKRK